MTHDDDDDDETRPRAIDGVSRYITPTGMGATRRELSALLYEERPRIVEIVSWAAGNGDRSENGDYLYGKRRLREIDRRVRFLTRRIEKAIVVDPAAQTQRNRVFFGATVTYVTEEDVERTVVIVGVDEADLTVGQVSLASPVARALLGGQVGDEVRVMTPSGAELIEILAISYPEPVGVDAL
ncbi:transcription elongation factor GreB [Gluconacetobacter takamatsuzukensis]|uniref:Transcription elongation factor GreB n=1 Tax=Gluconacetobacter takamatsuzukensis TaxID=1286190 RepID=A0A7W4KCU5_9PROT|nr:transcription elongation factor GreB [Gluconacetobacter takamatsuzukensis]MBB2204588.1 transcription elongation factor GreB [Gluconacetobacter takamatsuzukensis]